jgi:cytochrome c2
MMIQPQMGINVPVNNADFIFENLWTVWKISPVEKMKIASLSSDKKRKIVYKHYGLIENPYNKHLPIGFVKRGEQLAMNCLACHAGQVLGKTVIGLPNRNIDLKSLYGDILFLNPIGGTMLKVAATSLGPERGIVNTFGMEQKSMLFRDEWMNLNLIPNNWGSFEHSIVNVPAWWNLKYRSHLFADNVLPITPRVFVSSATTPMDSGDNFRKFEANVSDAFNLARISKAPKYPKAINVEAASKGKDIFENSCSHCHGNYESGELIDYPNETIALTKVGTDPVRAMVTPSVSNALKFLANGWVAEDFKVPMNQSNGYIAPPLIGIWSTAPYLHNGSVPTLWDLLNPNSRPILWKAASDPEEYDLIKVGMAYEFQPFIKKEDREIDTQRSLYYDTRILGHSNVGHPFANKLSIEEKRDLLEYLKTL